MKIGVLLDHYFMPIRRAAAEAARAGFEGVQFYTTEGELAPERLTRSGEQELLRLFRGHGLELSALCADMGGGRFGDPAAVDQRVERTGRIIAQAARMGAAVVTAHVGTLSADANDPARKLIYEAVDAVGSAADRAGVLFAVETGQEPPAVLADMLDHFNNPALGVNYDPANLLMNGFDPLAGVAVLAERIVYVHAKDATRGGEASGREAPLGAGQVDYPAFAAELAAAGYAGWHTVERKYSRDAVAELASACDYLKRLRGDVRG